MSAASAGSDAPPVQAIADLSYRSYDGPLRAHPVRWWIIARAMCRMALKRKGFWVLALLAALPYLLAGFQLYLRSRAPREVAALLSQRSFSSFFYDAYSQNQLWIFLMGLLVGAASIAGDNRTHALQIYLSKPITRGDYMLGKWAGIFLPLGLTALVPALVLYLYCLTSFLQQGFLSDNPHLWWNILLTSLLSPALHATLILGLSAWFRRPVLAGGIYAGLYFGLPIVFGIVAVIIVRGGDAVRAQTLTHVHIVGILRGIAQHLFGVIPTFFGMPIPGPRGMGQHKPDLATLIIIGALLVVLALAGAFARIRAVEVVRG